jgi:hypothetical protein
MGWTRTDVSEDKWQAFVAQLLLQRKTWPRDFICYPLFVDEKVLMMIWCAAGEGAAQHYIAPLIAAVGVPVQHSDCCIKSYLEAQLYTDQVAFFSWIRKSLCCSLSLSQCVSQRAHIRAYRLSCFQSAEM